MSIIFLLLVGDHVDAFDTGGWVWRHAVVETVIQEKELFTVKYKRIPKRVPLTVAHEMILPLGSGLKGRREDDEMKVPVKGQEFKVGDFADLRDGHDNCLWRVAEVLEVAEKDVHFRFLGWAEDRWNAWVPIGSPFIGPPFSVVCGFTGSEKPSLPDPCSANCIWKRVMSVDPDDLATIEHVVQCCLVLTPACKLLDSAKFIMALQRSLERTKKSSLSDFARLLLGKLLLSVADNEKRRVASETLNRSYKTEAEVAIPEGVQDTEVKEDMSCSICLGCCVMQSCVTMSTTMKTTTTSPADTHFAHCVSTPPS